MTHAHAKKSSSMISWFKCGKNGRTDTTDRITLPASAVDKYVLRSSTHLTPVCVTTLSTLFMGDMGMSGDPANRWTLPEDAQSSLVCGSHQLRRMLRLWLSLNTPNGGALPLFSGISMLIPNAWTAILRLIIFAAFTAYLICISINYVDARCNAISSLGPVDDAFYVRYTTVSKCSLMTTNRVYFTRATLC